MEILISLAVAYLISGFAQVSNDLRAPPLNKPMWAMRPTMIKVLLNLVIWPLSNMLNLYFSTRQLGRSFAYGLLSSIQQWGWVALLVYGSIVISQLVSDSAIVQTFVAIPLVGVGFVVLGPFISLLMVPVTLLCGFVLDLVFPRREASAGGSDESHLVAAFEEMVKGWPLEQAQAAIKLVENILNGHGEVDEYFDELTVVQAEVVQQFVREHGHDAETENA